MKKIALWLAWKVDRLCRRIIEKLDPIPDEEMRRVLDVLLENKDEAIKKYREKTCS